MGCGESQQSAPAPEAKPDEPVAEVPAPPPPSEANPAEPVAEAATPEPPTTKAPDISIHKAAAKGDIEAVRQHLDAGTDVNAKNFIEITALHSATTKEIALLLISKGADVNTRGGMAGGAPLLSAASGGRKEIVELLIAEGADVNAKDYAKYTPLHYAALSGHKEIVELLIAIVSDMNSKTRNDHTPLDLALNFEKQETAALLRKHGGKTKVELKAEGK